MSTAWDNSANWTGGLPGTNDTAFIAKVSNSCTISNSVSVGLITIQNTAVLNFGNGTNSILRIYGIGDFGNNGTVNLNQGTIIFYNSVNFANNFVFNAGSGTIIMNGGTWQNGNNAVFNPDTSTVEFTGTNQTVIAPNSGIEFYNAEFTGTGEMSLIGEVTVLNDAHVTTNTTLVVDTFTVVGEYINEGPIIDDQPHMQFVYTPSLTNLIIQFYEPVSASSAQTIANYSITNSLTNTITVLSATRDAVNLNRVNLTTAPMARGTEYMLVVNNLQDTNSPARTIAAGSLKRFLVSPTPQLFSLSATNVTAGSAGFTLALTGTNFVTNSTVLLNGTEYSTTFVGTNQLTAAIPATLLLSTGLYTVLVTNEYPNQGLSSSLAFTVSTNTAPSFTKGVDKTVLEDAGAQTFAGWATSISAGPVYESSQTLSFIVTNNNNALFAVQPSVAANGTLTFTPAANVYGSATVSTVLSDSGGTISGGVNTSAAQTFTITVTSVNDAPGFVKGSDQSVMASAGAQTIPAWATSISPGVNESSQIVSFIVTNNSNALFSVQPSIASNGTLTYTPAPGANGTATVTVIATDDGGTSNGGVNASAAQTFLITLASINNAPSFTKGADLIVLEDSGAQSMLNWATGISTGAAYETNQALNFVVSNDNNALFSQQPAVSASGTLTFTPTTNANGSATVTISLHDNGGTTGGGVDTSAAQTFTISVTAVNDSPALTPGADIIALEDSGTTTLTNWATISKGPSDESAQSVTLSVTNNNPLLFSAAPTVSTSGTVSFTPATNANGTAQVTVTLQDNGGTANGASDTTVATFDIVISPVNDVPSFTKGADQNVRPASRAVSVAGWAKSISAGPANESSQNLTFIVTNDSPADFAVQPAISSNGTLTFEIDPEVPNVFATVSARLSDNGGITNGGNDTSEEQTFRITLSTSSTSYAVTNALGSAPAGMWLANLRNKGTWRDLTVADYANNSISVRLCRDNGTFASPTNYPVGLHPVAVCAGDYNRDGIEDIACANSGTNTVSVLLNLRNAALGTAASYLVGSTSDPKPTAITCGDVNRDGRADILVANFNEGSVSVLKNSNGQGFAAAVNYSVGNGPSSIQFVDLNGDGFRDILTANKTDGTLSILSGNSDGTFSDGSTIALFAGGNPQPVHAFAANLNDDGILDLVVANCGSNSVSVLFGLGDGEFDLPTSYAVGSNPRSLLIRDLNHDGLPDIAVVDSGSASVHTLLNEGDGTFVSGDTIAVGSNPHTIVGSNFDSDGATDFAVSNFGDGTISIFRYAGPLAYDQSLKVYEDTPTMVTLNGKALEGSLQYEITEAPLHGNLSGTAPRLIYTPAADYFGPDSFKYITKSQSAETVLESAPALVSLNIASRNDAPSFELSTNQIVVWEDSPLVTIAQIATNISAGPANEANQSVSFVLDAGSLTSKVRPAISPTGTLTVLPQANFVGVVLISVRLKDSGARSAGETNLSAPQTLTISVLPNLVKPLSGNYSGLFYETSGAAHERSGYFSLKMTASRSFSGKITLAGTSFGLTGRFDTSGFAQVIIPKGETSVTLSLQLDLSGTDRITGSVGDGTWSAALAGDRLIYDSETNSAAKAGQYTFAFPGNETQTNVPAGYSFGNINIDEDGKVRVGGMLSDGSSLSQSAALSKNGKVPFYSSLYSGKGSVLGWLTFTNRTTCSVESVVWWTKTGAASGTLYPGGFTNSSSLYGSTFTIPTSGDRVLSLTNGTLSLRCGNLTNTITNSLTLKTNNTFAVAATPPMTLLVTTADGRLAGSFYHPVTKKTTPIRGVVLQQSSCAHGFFLGTNAGGSISIQKN